MEKYGSCIVQSADCKDLDLILGKGSGFSLIVSTSSKAHPVSYPMGTGATWGQKATRVWS